MSFRSWLIVGVMWVTSLVAVGATVNTQARQFVPLAEPKVMSGDDLGFRVEGMIGNMPAGTIVVRVNGNWVAVTENPNPKFVR